MPIEEIAVNEIHGFRDGKGGVVFYRKISDHYLVYTPLIELQVSENIAYLPGLQILDGNTPEEEVRSTARRLLESRV